MRNEIFSLKRDSVSNHDAATCLRHLINASSMHQLSDDTKKSKFILETWTLANVADDKKVNTAQPSLETSHSRFDRLGRLCLLGRYRRYGGIAFSIAPRIHF